MTTNDFGPIFLTGSRDVIVPHIVANQYDMQHSNFVRHLLHEDQDVKNSYAFSKGSQLRWEGEEKDAITSELSKVIREEFLDKKRRQRLREESDELRTLAEQLRVASITKDIADRMKVSNKRNLAETAKAAARQRAEEQRLEILVKDPECEQRAKARQLHEILTQQMQERQQRRQQKCAETLIDRQHALAVERQIKEEDKAELLELKNEKIRKRLEMEHFLKQKALHAEEQKKQVNDHLMQVLKHQEIEFAKKLQMEADRKDLIRKQQEISQRIGEKVLGIENQKRHREELLMLLLQEELQGRLDRRDQQKLEQEVQTRQNNREDLARYRMNVLQREENKRRKKHEEAIATQADSPNKLDVEFKNGLLAEHRKRKQHGVLLLSMINENQRKRAEATAENIRFYEMQAKKEAERQKHISVERHIMMAEVGKSVLRYLPPNVLTNADRTKFDLPKQRELGGGDS